ncbi:hypothetical protein [Bradyrhizobium lablabi]|uniref:hypothetical protein n=1 Tax=Bradyrhizobium lablabi TaxID=722472 RepID=UPI001BABEFD4|nr:hypothetical protein [Bradyrhizobium lablabi]MBR0696943.1 hypothetical protein [Bradyrhizobium lablabi]
MRGRPRSAEEGTIGRGDCSAWLRTICLRARVTASCDQVDELDDVHGVKATTELVQIAKSASLARKRLDQRTAIGEAPPDRPGCRGASKQKSCKIGGPSRQAGLMFRQ